MKKLLTLLSVISLLLITSGKSYAAQQASRSSATLTTTVSEPEIDNRTAILESYLAQYNSPLAPYASDFIKSADKYNLDWRLVAAISGLESGFGKEIPYNSYNGWGWGIYGNSVLRFSSWSEGIETISQGLRERYLRSTVESNPYIIGPTYAASPTWAVRVSFFMEQMDLYRIRNAKSTLSLAL